MANLEEEVLGLGLHPQEELDASVLLAAEPDEITLDEDSMDLEAALKDCHQEEEPGEKKGEKSKLSEASFHDLIICEEEVLDETLPPHASSTPVRKSSPPEHPFPGDDIRKKLDERERTQLQEENERKYARAIELAAARSKRDRERKERKEQERKERKERERKERRKQKEKEKMEQARKTRIPATLRLGPPPPSPIRSPTPPRPASTPAPPPASQDTRP